MLHPAAPIAAALLAGCVTPLPPTIGSATDAPGTTAPDPEPTVDPPTATADTAGTPTTPPPPADCVADGTFAVFTYDIETEEDFDFDGEGKIVHQGTFGVIAEDIAGNRRTIAQLLAVDPAGIRVLPDGDLASAQPDTGTVKWIDYVTGGTLVLASSLDNPNGLVVARDGTLYVSELTQPAHVHEIAPDGTVTQLLGGASFPNNMALSGDERTLYVTMYTAGQVVALDKDADGTWSAPRLFYDVGGPVEAIAVDACDHVYVAPFNGGRLVRISPDGATVEDLCDLPTGFVTSMRFGSGLGGWQKDGLYLTNRSQVYGIHVGVDGQRAVWE